MGVGYDISTHHDWSICRMGNSQIVKRVTLL
jgi:hypothetical protein